VSRSFCIRAVQGAYREIASRSSSYGW
jgi:hypothetical protein